MPAVACGTANPDRHKPDLQPPSEAEAANAARGQCRRYYLSEFPEMRIGPSRRPKNTLLVAQTTPSELPNAHSSTPAIASLASYAKECFEFDRECPILCRASETVSRSSSRRDRECRCPGHKVRFSS
jgi:hypothetical protein